MAPSGVTKCGEGGAGFWQLNGTEGVSVSCATGVVCAGRRAAAGVGVLVGVGADGAGDGAACWVVGVPVPQPLTARRVAAAAALTASAGFITDPRNRTNRAPLDLAACRRLRGNSLS